MDVRGQLPRPPLLIINELQHAGFFTSNGCVLCEKSGMFSKAVRFLVLRFDPVS